MKYILSKCSSPGWEKVYDTEYDARIELRSHICNDCMLGDYTYVGENGELITEEGFDDEPVDPNNIHDLLGTACGCEFEYEEVE